MAAPFDSRNGEVWYDKSIPPHSRCHAMYLPNSCWFFFFPSPFLDWLAGEVIFPLISLCFFSPRSSAGFTLRRCREIFFLSGSLLRDITMSQRGPRVTPNTFCNLSVGYLSYCTAQSRLPELSLFSLRLFCTMWLCRVTVTSEHIWFVCSIDEDLFFFCSD